MTQRERCSREAQHMWRWLGRKQQHQPRNVQPIRGQFNIAAVVSQCNDTLIARPLVHSSKIAAGCYREHRGIPLDFPCEGSRKTINLNREAKILSGHFSPTKCHQAVQDMRKTLAEDKISEAQQRLERRKHLPDWHWATF